MLSDVAMANQRYKVPGPSPGSLTGPGLQDFAGRRLGRVARSLSAAGLAEQTGDQGHRRLAIGVIDGDTISGDKRIWQEPV